MFWASTETEIWPRDRGGFTGGKVAGGFLSCESAEYLHRSADRSDAGWGDEAGGPEGRLVRGEGLNYYLFSRARGETGRRTTLRW